MSETAVTEAIKGHLQRLEGWRKPAATPGGLGDSTLVVPTYRRPQAMQTLLQALAQLPDCPGEVIVVDGSPDEAVAQAMPAWAQGRCLAFDLVYVKSPPGLTRQRNVGIDATRRQFIFFLDDDCLPEPGYFRSIRQVFHDDASGEIGGVRGFFTNSIGAPLTGLWRLRLALRLAKPGPPGQYYHTGTSGTWNNVRPFQGTRWVDVLAGGAAAYRREVFTRHRFSQFFYGYSQGEDLEMSRRIARDWKLAVCGEALVAHNHAEGGRPAGLARGRMAMRNRYFIWKRHSPEATAKDRFGFWMDHLLIVLYNLAGFLRPPWQPAYLLYALGTLFGAVECWVNPPRYDEPPARREYEFALKELACA